MDSKRVRRLAAIVLGIFSTPLFAPQLLAFPHHARVGGIVVEADAPFAPDITTVIARADRLRRASPINSPDYGHRVFLTDGGWRWRWLAVGASGAFALTRPFTEVIVVNRSDVARDRVFNANVIGGERSLSGVLAHEQTHGLIRARYGLLADARYPAWLREGYCDVVAGGGSLSDAQAALLDRHDPAHPALLYYHGRKRVEGLLRADGGSVDRVFAGAARW